MKEWKQTVIETGVDKLLDYLVENKIASVGQISQDLGIPEDRIKGWAKALEDENMIDKRYSATKGTILEFTPKTRRSQPRSMSR